MESPMYASCALLSPKISPQRLTPFGLNRQRHQVADLAAREGWQLPLKARDVGFPAMRLTLGFEEPSGSEVALKKTCPACVSPFSLLYDT